MASWSPQLPSPDLGRITAFVPAPSAEPSQVASGLLDTLIGTLHYSFAFVRLSDPDGGPSIELARAVAPEFGEALRLGLENVLTNCLAGARVPIGAAEFSAASVPLGLDGEFGMVVVGSQNVDFPQQTQLLVHIAANRAAMALQQVRLQSEQKRTRELATANEELNQSRLELRMVLNSIPQAVGLVKPTGELEVANRQLLEYFGKTFEEATHCEMKDIVHPEDLPEALKQPSRSIESRTPYEGAPFELEARLLRNGEYCLQLVRYSPLKDETGRIVRWYVTATDLEDGKRAEAELKQAYLQLKEAQRLSKTGSFISDARANEHRLSEEAFRIFEFDPGVKVSLEMIRDIVHPEDLQSYEAAVARAVAGVDLDVIYRIVTPRGAVKHVRTTAHVVEQIGERPIFLGALQDVTESKVAEEALRASERNLRLITQTIPGMLWSATAEGEVDYCNDPWLDFAAMNAERAKGWGWATAIHPGDRDGLIERWRSCLASGKPFDAEARMCRFDGAYRWLLFRANPLREESGKIVKWYGTNIDIEDRKRREEALEASEVSWRQIIDNIPGFVHTTSGTGEPEFISRQTREYFGKTNDELKNWSRVDVTHPDDLARVIEAWKSSIETGQTFEIEQRCRRADGVYRWFHTRGRAVRNANGEITAWYWLLTDIEDRKRTEAELREAYLHQATAQQLSKTGSFIADLVEDIHVWSAELYRICEVDPATKPNVPMFRNFVHDDDKATFDALIARGLTGVDVDFMFRIVTPSGIVKHLRGMAHIFEHVAGRPLFIGAIQDVTESKIAEDALNRARSELAHVARVTALNALTASIAHEVNQPLSGIITNAGTCLRMLSANPPNVDGARETVRRTIRDGNRASDVIKRLRALYSKKEFTLEPLDLNEAAQEVIALSLADLQRNRVILRPELADGLPPVNGDRVQLQQVILNLVRNASDAMVNVQDRPRELGIKTERDENDRVRFSVTDAGVGFGPETADKLFEAFYTTKGDGMGIGLSVSRSIIEAHRGRLWATVNDGPGATFSFAIPVSAQSIAAKRI
jgi:PAS domain S-box-containing protein